MPSHYRKVKGVQPRVYHWRRYEGKLRKLILDPLFRDIEHRIAEAGENYVRIRAAIRNIPLDPALAGLTATAATTYVRQMEAWHKARFTASMRRAVGVDIRPLLNEMGIRGIIQRAVQDNVALIKTIPPRFHDDLAKRMLTLTHEAPFDQKALRDVLSKSFGSAGYNLRRLTRDQTQKLISNLNQARQQQSGLDEYIWETALDDRVRPSHAEKDGRVFRWDQPPVDTGHPGTDVNCRCVGTGIVTRSQRDSLRAHLPAS